MKYKKVSISLITFFMIFQGILFFSIQNIKANGVIPSTYYQSLDMSNTYIYNVTFWGGEDPAIIRWEGFDFGIVHGYANSSVSGQIHVNFIGFYEKHPWDWGLFESPLPYLNISFYEYKSNLLLLNSSFYNFSSSETSMIMGLGFNTFFAGFLIPIHNFTWLTQQAYTQASGYFENATVSVDEYLDMIKIDFSLDPGGILLSQKTSLIYNKTTGVLLWADVEIEGGAADYEIQLLGYDYFWPEPETEEIDSYPIFMLLGIIGIISIVSIFKIKKKKN